MTPFNPFNEINYATYSLIEIGSVKHYHELWKHKKMWNKRGDLKSEFCIRVNEEYVAIYATNNNKNIQQLRMDLKQEK